MNDKDQIKCPFCDVKITLEKGFNFFEYFLPPIPGKKDITAQHEPRQTQFAFVKCHSCGETSIHARNSSAQNHFSRMVYPLGSCNDYSENVPAAICQDYQEASFIVDLSPKSAATLCRRCLQGMIRDHWNISTGNLGHEIEQLKPLVSETQWKAIDSVRKIGNIGAHMEKDVNVIVDIHPSEAARLIELIEYLIFEWYIAPCESEKLYNRLFDAESAILSRRQPEDHVQR